MEVGTSETTLNCLSGPAQERGGWGCAGKGRGRGHAHEKNQAAALQAQGFI